MLLLVLLYSYIYSMRSGAIVYIGFFIIYSVYVRDRLYSILLSYGIVNVVALRQLNRVGISVKDSLYTGDFHICI